MRNHRYLILAEGHFGPESSKTATSAVRYLPERVAAVIDSRFAGKTAADVLGFGGAIPMVSTLAEGLSHLPSALLVGIAPQGGRLPEPWREVLRGAARAGLDLVSGLHTYLSDDPEFVRLATREGVRLWDLREPPGDLPVSTGLAREVDSFTVLTVGTDCNVGKMTAALEMRAALQERGVKTAFAASGQTGILIEGRGIAVDAVKADFIAGAAERLVLEAAAEGPEVILVEGQGSLVHPGYSGVTLGLLHGSLPDAMILCHLPTRQHVYGGDGAYSWMPLPPLAQMVEVCERAAEPLKPSRVIGVALNSWDLREDEALRAVERAEEETGLPATDPVRFGAGPLAEAVIQARSAGLGKGKLAAYAPLADSGA
ncbi:MAG: DUF1611 domain-containing protein [Longimicrobiaceae bacterium]